MKTIYTILVVLLFLYSCNSDNFEDKFIGTPNERIQADIDKYSEVLTSAAHGWKMAYYINESNMGALHFMMQFKPDNHVISQFELSSTGKNSESTYSLRAEDEIALSFDTYTFFSALAEPAVTEDGKGFGGEFEFFIHHASADSVVMIGKNKRRKAVMYPASEFDWNDKFASIKTMQNHLFKQSQPVLGSNDYAIRKLVFKTGLSEKETVDVVYHSGAKRMKVAYRGVDGKITVSDRSIEFTNEGFKTLKPLVIKDMVFQEFIYNASENHYVEKNGLCSIDYQVNADALISNTYPLWEHQWHVTDDWESSESLKPYIKEAVKVLGEDNAGLVLFLHTNALVNWSFRYRSNGGDGWCDFFLRNLFLDELNNISFIAPDNDDQKYDLSREMSGNLFKNPKVHEFIDILHDAKGWLVIEMEYKQKYRMVSKKDNKHWLTLVLGDPK